ncbi:MAG TPA: HAMP domain-containing sensor histidine kinase [Vicinamibacterales bacterium]|nr:HAMP domain-containing sensor histidine kinase [Vicinamibacterales bacterium]
MTNAPIDPRWPKLLSLAVHEFRTPITVVAGYIRMLLRERAGPISDQQRKLLEEAEKSCGRLSALVSEMSDLSALEGGKTTLNRGTVELHALLSDAIASLPPLPDREVRVELEGDGPVSASADATRLKGAFAALVMALRRELVTSDRLVVRLLARDGASRVVIGAPERIEGLAGADPDALSRFNEWRGGSGLSLAVARRIIDQHGGTLYGGHDEEDKAGALVVLPRVGDGG